MSDPLESALLATLADRSVSRGERDAFRALLESARPDDRARAILRSRAFEAARADVDDPRARETIAWLEEVVKLLAGDRRGATASLAEAHFSPGAACRDRISGLLRTAEKTADICVFTIADDRISDAIRDAHRRGVLVRIVTDDEKAGDAGSDVDDLARAGIAVAVDRSPCHMHHKFAIIDGRALLTGSYNWTRGAAERNEENLVVSDDPRLVTAFAAEFERLWRRFA